jgi:hypothetical protein
MFNIWAKLFSGVSKEAFLNHKIAFLVPRTTFLTLKMAFFTLKTIFLAPKMTFLTPKTIFLALKMIFLASKTIYLIHKMISTEFITGFPIAPVPSLLSTFAARQASFASQGLQKSLPARPALTHELRSEAHLIKFA